MSTAILYLLMCQAGIAHPSTPGRMQMPNWNSGAPAVPDSQDESPAHEAAYEERELVQHLNGLLRALNDFAATYKAGLVDVKKVRAVQKALHELEKSEMVQASARSAQRGGRTQVTLTKGGVERVGFPGSTFASNCYARNPARPSGLGSQFGE